MKNAILVLILVAFGFTAVQDKKQVDQKMLQAHLKELIKENTLIHYHEKKGWITEAEADELLHDNRKAMRKVRDEILDMKYGHLTPENTK